MERGRHKGWYWRGRRPHFDQAHVAQHVVFRLVDSLPPSVRESMQNAKVIDRLDMAEGALDAGAGSGALAEPRAAQIVEDALLHFDARRYSLLAWCVMPNHVHVLIEQQEGWTLSAVVQSWKSFTAKAIARPLDARGRFWAPSYFDRYMRNEEQLRATAAYIEYNPVKAGLCAEAVDWPWSSARRKESEQIFL